MLPDMLSREIWECPIWRYNLLVIHEMVPLTNLPSSATPSSKLSMRLLQPSPYVRKRFLRVLLYNTCVGVQQNCSSSDDATVFGFVMRWEFSLKVWHEAIAQLLADGVPPERLPAKEVREIVYILDVYKKKIKEWRCLPKWTYNPTFDKPSSKASVEALETPSLGDTQGDILDDRDKVDLKKYQAIGDEGREEDTKSLFEHQDDQDSSDGYVWPSDEYLLEVLNYSDP